MKISTSSMACYAIYGIVLSSAAWAQPPQVTIIEKPAVKAAPKIPTLELTTWDELSQQIGGPTLVTLPAGEITGAEAVDALAAQTPLEVQIQARSRWEKEKQSFGADAKAQPFWLAALNIADKFGGSVREYNGTGVTFSTRNEGKRGLLFQSGPGLFHLQRASYNRLVTLDETDSDTNESLLLTGTLYIEPKLQWQNNGLFMQLLEAIDDKNQSLLLTDNRRLSSKGNTHDLYFNLKPPAARGGKLKRLRGNVHGVVAFQSTTWEVKDVLQASHVEKILQAGENTTRLELQNVKAENDNYLVTIVISQSGDQNQQRARLSNGQLVRLNTDPSDNRPRLLDAQNRELRVRSTRVQQNGDEKTRITTLSVTFAPNRSNDAADQTGAPAKLVMRFDSDWRELIVPFEYENVDLP